MATASMTAPTRAKRRRAPERPDRQTPYVNVGDVERWVSLIGGGALAAYGLAERSLTGLGLAAVGGSLVYRGATGHCPFYQTLGVCTAEARGPVTSVPASHGVRFERALTINRTPEELFRFWRDFANLPRFMHHLKAVEDRGNGRSHWVARAPLGYEVEWDAEVHNEKPNELIAWRSLEGSEVDTAGSVHFTRAPGDRGTEVRVVLKYNPPAGKLGAAVAKLFGEAPEQQITEDLRCFKQMMEAGEIATVQGQTSCRARES